MLVVCAVAMLAVANLQYAWTLFTTPLTDHLGTSLAKVQWAFTFFVLSQALLMPLNTLLVDRFGVRIVVMIGGLFVGVGWMGAGLARSLTELYFAYGLGGVGVGAVYGACIGLAMKWFYNRRGLCVGVVAGSYGFGTALTAIPISHMIKISGYQSTFIMWGAIQGLIVLIAAQFLITPPAGWLPPSRTGGEIKKPSRLKQSKRDYEPREMLKSLPFYVLYLMMILVTFSGLMVTAQLQPIGVKYSFDKYVLLGSLTVLNIAIPLNSVLNGSARPFFGFLADRVGRYETMAMVFCLEAVALTTLTFVVSRPIWFIIVSGVILFAWGDVYSSFPSAIADIFGAKHATTNYGIQYTAKGIGGIFAGPCAAWLMERAGGSWIPVFWSGVACNVLAALLAIFWLKPMVTRLLGESKTAEVTSETVPVEVRQAASGD